MANVPRLHGRTPLQKFLCYDVFHNNNNYSLNVTNNYYGGSIWGGFGCWGGGSFGSGIAWGAGYGIGAGIMNLLGLGGGGWGGGCFGGGGSWWNPTSWWGGGGRTPASTTTTTTTTTGGNSTTITGGDTYITKSPKDKDDKPIRKLCKRYKNLLNKKEKIEQKGNNPLSDPSFMKDLKSLYNEVVSHKELDGNNDENNQNALDKLQKDLEELYQPLKKDGQDEAIQQNEITEVRLEPTDTTDKTETPVKQDPTDEEELETDNGEPVTNTENPPSSGNADGITNNGSPIQTPVNTPTTNPKDKEVDFENLPETWDAETIAAYKDATEKLDYNEDYETLVSLTNSNIPVDIRKVAKAKFYAKFPDEKGAVNLTDNERQSVDINSRGGISIIDTSDKIGDFKKRAIISYENGIITVQVTANDKIKYKYKETTDDGEQIFVSNKDQQEYIMQKDGNGKIYLMQYKWHKGYDEGDLNERTKHNDNFGI